MIWWYKGGSWSNFRKVEELWKSGSASWAAESSYSAIKILKMINVHWLYIMWTSRWASGRWFADYGNNCIVTMFSAVQRVIMVQRVSLIDRSAVWGDGAWPLCTNMWGNKMLLFTIKMVLKRNYICFEVTKPFVWFQTNNSSSFSPVYSTVLFCPTFLLPYMLCQNIHQF